MEYIQKQRDVQAQKWDGNAEIWQDRAKNALLIEAYEAGQLTICHGYLEVHPNSRVKRVIYKGDYIVKEPDGGFYRASEVEFEKWFEAKEAESHD